MPARTRSYIYLILVAAIWGFAPPITKQSFPYFSPLLFLTYRFFITCLVMIPLLLLLEPKTWHNLHNLSHKDWFMLTASGLLGSTFQLGLLFWGLNLTTSLDASFINSMSPVFVALAGFYILHEKISRRELLGHVLAFIGTLIIVMQSVFEGQALFSGSVLGNFLVLTGTWAWTAYVILSKKQLAHKLSPLLLTVFMFFAGFISMSFLIFLTHSQSAVSISTALSAAPLSAHLGVIYMAYVSGALAYWLYQTAQKNIEVSEANIFLYLPPLFTLPLSYFWLREPITIPFCIGGGVIALGVIISELGRKRTHHI